VASAAHGKELHAFREESDKTIEQINAAHQATIESLKAEQAAALDTQAKELEKKLSTQALELKATQDDLVKAKACVDETRAEVGSLTTQRDEAQKEAAALAAASPPPGQAEEIERLTRELKVSKDDQTATSEMLALTRASMEEQMTSQAKELEEVAKCHAEEVAKLRAAHDEEMANLATAKSELMVKISDLEGELATVKASLEAEHAAPRTNGAVHPASPGISEVELQQMHQAHNLKLHDLQAESEKATKVLKEELEKATCRIDELQQDVARKAMEIQYLEQEQDEKEDLIIKYV